MALLGSALANLGKLDEAKKWCRQAINAEKLRPSYYYLLASIYQEQGNLNESVKLLKKAIYLDSKFVMAHFAKSYKFSGVPLIPSRQSCFISIRICQYANPFRMDSI